MLHNAGARVILIIMGVSGSGKTTVGRLLASHLRCDFVDADDHHPPQNRLKMQKGIPLTEEDRIPWLDTLSDLIHDHKEKGASMVLACSALRKAYRAKLGVDQKMVRTVYLKGERKEITRRLSRRKHEFFNPSLLDSQFATLEEPQSGLILPLKLKPEEQIDRIVQWIQQ